MLLYHGSNVAVENPQIISSDRKLDFGNGFYLTSSYDQAARWAELTTKRREGGKAIISTFEINEKSMDSLSLLKFETATNDWLQYISANRSGASDNNDYDIVVGPVANDQAMPSISLYLMNFINVEETIRRLLPQKLRDQFVFKTEKALSLLSFVEATHG